MWNSLKAFVGIFVFQVTEFLTEISLSNLTVVKVDFRRLYSKENNQKVFT
jgi:hypothetical protein